ncbi:MAG: histidine kinase [Bacillales bacterium]|jgi:signal transduction histidine kinase|nr:histidine kinase [Bacillales bacterium]
MSKQNNEFIDQIFDGLLEEWMLKSIYPLGYKKMDILKKHRSYLLDTLKSFLLGMNDKQKILECFEVISNERVYTIKTIDDFVFNTNILKRLLYFRIIYLDTNIEVCKESVNKGNEFIDDYMYYVTSKFTKYYSDTIEERTRQIEESHHDRLSILGQISSSFVHEFRNPLTSIIGFVKLLKDENNDLPYLEIVSYELEQLNDRITQFLTLSRKEVATPKDSHFSLSVLIEDVVTFLYPSLVDNNITIFKYLESDLYIFGNRSELRQVILNILMNSVDALRMNGKDRTINIDLNSLSEMDAVLTISNNGPIIDDDKLSTIFEPFYTTKDVGTGIGLFVCKQILEKHKGKIDCYSNNKITKFTIELPLTKIIDENQILKIK